MSKFPKISYNNGVVRVEVNLQGFEARHKKAQQWLGDRVLEDSRTCMPLLTGGLQQRSHTEDDGKKVVFPGPYSGYLYRGKVMVDSATGKGPRKIPTAPGEYILRFRKGAKLIPTSRKLTYSNPQAVPEWFEHAKAKNKQFWIQGVGEILGGKS